MNNTTNGATVAGKAITRSIFISCFALLCVIGNTLVLLSLKRHPNLRTPANVILGSLAVSDILTTFPLSVRAYSLATARYHGLHADIQAWLSTTFVAIASLHITCISIDRYISIKYALRYNNVVTMDRVVGLLVFIWNSSLVIVGVIPLIAAMVVPDARQPNAIMLYYKIKDGKQIPLWLVSYKVVVFLSYFLLPFLAMVVSYSYITKVVLAKLKAIRPEGQALKQVKSTKTVFIVVAVFFTLNSPYSMVNLVMIFTVKEELRVWSQYMLILASFSSCVNPFIYAYRDRHFKRAFNQILCRKP